MIRTFIKRTIVTTPLYHPYVELRYRFAGRGVAKWVRNGRPPPPPHRVKQEVVRSYRREFGLSILVETGTYLGDMVDAMKEDFSRIVSIELDRTLAKQAKEHFRSCRNVEVMEGDSSEILPQVLSTLRAPALFWLDGHFSSGITAKGVGNTPVVAELSAILGGDESQHVVLIDDARDFGRARDYPSLDQLRAIVQTRRPGWEVTLKDDIIRVHGTRRIDALRGTKATDKHDGR